MKKIIILEGLPHVGKTTIVNKIKALNLNNVYTVDEIVKPEIIGKVSSDEKEYMLNDEMKLKKYNEGLIIIDRGPISTLSYNQTNAIIDENFDSQPVVDWFVKIQNELNASNLETIYLKNKNSEYYLPYENTMDAFGSIDNQQLLESISIFNCKKYCFNFQIRDYDKKNMEEVINEIIN